MKKLKKKQKDVESEKFTCVKTDVKTIFNFDRFKNSFDLASDINRNKSLLKNTENKQKEIKIILNELKKYSPTNLKNIKAKKETLSAAEKLLNNRQEVINAFKTGIFPYIDGYQIKKESEEESKEKIRESIR